MRAGDVDRDRRAGRERVEGRAEAAVGEHRRVQAAGDLAQLGERLVELGARVGEHPARRLRVALELALDHPHA